MTEQAQQKSGKKILLIDDDKFLLEMYAMKFNQMGYEAQAALSVKEALDVMSKGLNPDAVVFDLIMPEMDGFALLERMRADKLVPGALKVALSNQTSDAEQTKAKDMGADLFLVKASLIPSEVVNTVTAELTKRAAR